MAVRLDDLCINGYKIYQDDECFRFGTDAVLLAWFAGSKKFAKAADLCSGNGVIPVILSTHACCREARGYEILENQVKLAKMTAEFNKIEDKVAFYVRDIRQSDNDEIFPHGYFDLVTANPPYMTANSGFVSENYGTARTELSCDFAEVCRAAKVLLKNGGRFCTVNKPDRLTDAICIMRENGIEPKRLAFVFPRRGKKPELFLLEGIKNGKSGLLCEPAIEIYGPDGKYTETFNGIYGRI